jgi:hypothetical protein
METYILSLCIRGVFLLKLNQILIDSIYLQERPNCSRIPVPRIAFIVDFIKVECTLRSYGDVARNIDAVDLPSCH